MSEKNKSIRREKEEKPEVSPGRDYVVIRSEEYERFLQWSERRISLFKMIGLLKHNIGFITKLTLAAGFFGVITTFLIQAEYTSTATLLPEYNTESSVGGTAQKLLQNYGGLLGMSGGTYASRSNAIRVELYPKIVESIPLQLDLIEHPYYYPEYDTAVSLVTYFNSLHEPSLLNYIMAYTIGLPFTVKDWLTKNNENQTVDTYPANDESRMDIYSLSKEKMDIIKIMQERVRASLDQESGVLTVSATMPDPQLSAVVARKTIDTLTHYLVKYRTKKLKTDLQYTKKQYEKAERRFKSIQDSLAAFRDQNRNIITSKAQTEEQRLQSRYDLAYNLYQTMAEQLEQTKLRLQEETPVFKVLQPVQVPLEKSSPNRMLIVLIFIFLGVIGSVGYLMFSE